MPPTLTTAPCPTASAAIALLDQCGAFVQALGVGEYTRPSALMFNGTVGQHVRHSLDHFAAALAALDGAPIDYDHRERGTAIETEPAAALALLDSLRGTLLGVGPSEARRPVRVRVMLTSAGDETDLASTLERELAFASHHAVHHHAMMAAICAERRTPVPAGFGKAPSTLKFESA